MDRCYSSLTLFALILFLNLPITSKAADQSSSSQLAPSSFRYSDIIAKRVRVVVDPIRVVLDEMLTNMSKKERPVCILALHRDECHGPRVKPNERIGWQDRLCLVWRCLRAGGLAMRVQDCWAGSGKSPILLIDQEGCTRESSMPSYKCAKFGGQIDWSDLLSNAKENNRTKVPLRAADDWSSALLIPYFPFLLINDQRLSTPHYRPLNQSAHSLGWLTVRLPHLDHIRLSCALKFCPICDPSCRQQTPPIQCADSADRGGEKWWHEKFEEETEEGAKGGIGQICGQKNEERINEGRNSGLKNILGVSICWLGIFIQIVYLLNL